MKIFIDTADVAEVREVQSWGIVDGVTTNPSLVAKSGRSLESVINEICTIVDGPISAEVVATEASAMIEEGERLAKIHKNIVVKCPMIIEGLKATLALAKRGIRVNVTLIFTPLQALAAAKVGASFLSPFIGRLDDIGQDGFQIVRLDDRKPATLVPFEDPKVQGAIGRMVTMERADNARKQYVKKLRNESYVEITRGYGAVEAKTDKPDKKS